jgi:hypothetical protein
LKLLTINNLRAYYTEIPPLSLVQAMATRNPYNVKNGKKLARSCALDQV